MKKYEHPTILKVIKLEMENKILSESVVVEDTSVSTTGQEIEIYDFSEDNFNTNSFWK